tara:strand:+ start:25 stop:447 length:423 start_codon:yes stop_codon:yes gene_type:complete
MFDTKSSFILSKLGIKRFWPQENQPNPEKFFGVLWGDILTLLDKSFNALNKNELTLLTKIIQAISNNDKNYQSSKEVNSLSELSVKPKLSIFFTNNMPTNFGGITPIVQSKPLKILKNSSDDKKKLWIKIKEYKNESSIS